MLLWPYDLTHNLPQVALPVLILVNRHRVEWITVTDLGNHALLAFFSNRIELSGLCFHLRSGRFACGRASSGDGPRLSTQSSYVEGASTCGPGGWPV